MVSYNNREDGSCKRKKKGCLLSSFYLKVRILSFIMFYSPKFEISYFFFLYYFLSSHFYFFSYFTLYHPTCYHFKFILGNWFLLHSLLLIPIITGQVPELSTLLIHSSFSSFYLYPQFGKSMLLVEHPTHKRVILIQRHSAMSLEKSKQKMILLLLHLLEYKIFIQLDTYCLIYYCPNNMVILLPQGEDL